MPSSPQKKKKCYQSFYINSEDTKFSKLIFKACVSMSVSLSLFYSLMYICSFIYFSIEYAFNNGEV